MSNVCIQPMPLSYRKISRKFRPWHGPIFPPNHVPTRDDIELAKALFMALDEESQGWYTHYSDDPVASFCNNLDRRYLEQADS